MEGVKITLDRERLFQFTLNEHIELEESGLEAGSSRYARRMIFLGLRHEDPELTEEQVGAMLTPGKLVEVMGIIERASDSTRPQKARRKR